MKTFIRVFFFLQILLQINTDIINAKWIQSNGPGGGRITKLASKESIVIANCYQTGVLISTNSGTNWAKTTLADFNAIAFYGSDIYAGTGTGVFVSTDYGNVWSQLNNGLNNLNVH